jgi:hypothetical protein
MPYYQKLRRKTVALNVAKVTLSFIQGAYGWTENYFLNNPSTNLVPELAKGNTLANKRLPLSGAQTFVQHIKVSNENTKRDVLLDLTTYQGNSSKPSDAPDTAVLIKKYGALPQQNAPVYLRGVWDEVIISGGQLDQTNAAWIAAYNAWVAELTSTSEGWGFLGLDPTATLTAQIATVTQNANGTIHVTLKTPTFGAGPYLPSQKVFISGVGGAASVNGPQIVSVSATSTFDTVKQIPMFPYTTGGKVTAQNQKFWPIASAQIQRVVERKVGRPLYLSRGRQRGRKLA